MTQALFSKALLQPDAPEPEMLRDPKGGPAGKRFNVYRNNVAVSLTEALEVGFPALNDLIGPTRFKALAGIFLRAHPPQDPRLARYGAQLAEFLEEFPPLQQYPYLADIARLELALREAYHAADAPQITADALLKMPETKLAAARLLLAPSVRLVRSHWPIVAIWQRSQSRTAAQPQPGPENALITRPEFDSKLHLLTDEEAEAFTTLAEGSPLGVAFERADPTKLLSLLLSEGAICDILEI